MEAGDGKVKSDGIMWDWDREGVGRSRIGKEAWVGWSGMRWVCTELFSEEISGPTRKDVKASTGRLEIGNTERLCGPVQWSCTAQTVLCSVVEKFVRMETSPPSLHGSLGA